MSWTILINTEPGHFKFWSYNGEQRCWGRIGSAGTCRNYPVEENAIKAQEKLNEGYRVFARDVNYSAPSPVQVDAWRRGETATQRTSNRMQVPPSDREIAAARVTERDPESEAVDIENQQTRTTEPAAPEIQGIRAAKYEREHAIPSEQSYKTDKQGFINYRQGYNRANVFDRYVNRIGTIAISQLMNSDGSRNSGSISYFTLAQQYFNRIPANTQYNKPENFAELRNPQRPTYVAVFFHNKPIDQGNNKPIECIGIYGINRNTGLCDFFSLKHDIPYRKTLMKVMLQKISNAVPTSTSTITFKIKSEATRNDIKSIAEFYQEEGDLLKYKQIDLSNGITLPQAQPKRWIE